MSISLTRLPSLDAVKGFVAVGRRMSITLAAQDLCLTQSAVSRQIHVLEEALGMKLLVRGHRSITFTAEGERLFRSADRAVQQLQDVVGELKRSNDQRVVTLTTPIGFAGLWLMPRLGGFIDAHPDIEVRLSASDRLVDLKAEGIQLAIRYGNYESMPAGAELLFGESVVPVAHPSLGISVLNNPAELERQVLLEFDGPYRPWLQWADWLAGHGWSAIRPKGMLRFNQYDQTIHAAMAGQGIALGRKPLVDAILADGRLVALEAHQAAPENGPAYWLIQANANPSPEVIRVVEWIRAQAALGAL